VYKDQSVSDLRLNLVAGPVDLRQFTLLQAGELDGLELRVAQGASGPERRAGHR